MESARHPNFLKLIQSLPKNVQNKAKETFKMWKEDPSMVNSHVLGGCSRNVFAIAFKIDGTEYRVVGAKSKSEEGIDRCLWLWVGSHEDYNNFVPSQRQRLKSPEVHFFTHHKVETMLEKMKERLQQNEANQVDENISNTPKRKR